MTDVTIHHGDYREVLDDVKADLIFTSPPYNIGSKSKRIDGYRRKGAYDPKSYGAITDYPDNLPEEEYQDGQVEFLRWAAEHLKSNGVLAYNHKPRRRRGRMVHPMEWFLRVPVLSLMEEIIWDRGSTHNHSNRLVWPHTERIYVFRLTDGEYPFLNAGDLRFRSDVWRINPAKANGHNAPFPEELAEAVIKAWSPKGGLVVDPYCGSGTSGAVSKRLERGFRGSEVLRKYYDLAVERVSARRMAC